MGFVQLEQTGESLHYHQHPLARKGRVGDAIGVRQVTHLRGSSDEGEKAEEGRGGGGKGKQG